MRHPYLYATFLFISTKSLCTKASIVVIDLQKRKNK